MCNIIAFWTNQTARSWPIAVPFLKTLVAFFGESKKKITVLGMPMFVHNYIYLYAIRNITTNAED